MHCSSPFTLKGCVDAINFVSRSLKGNKNKMVTKMHHMLVVKKSKLSKRVLLPWEDTHSDLFKVLKILGGGAEHRHYAQIIHLSSKLPFPVADWDTDWEFGRQSISKLHVDCVPLAEGSKTGGWYASHPTACCGQPQVYPVCQIKWRTSQIYRNQTTTKEYTCCKVMSCS